MVHVLQLFIMLGQGWEILCTINKLTMINIQDFPKSDTRGLILKKFVAYVKQAYLD